MTEVNENEEVDVQTEEVDGPTEEKSRSISISIRNLEGLSRLIERVGLKWREGLFTQSHLNGLSSVFQISMMFQLIGKPLPCGEGSRWLLII